jgi:hypothetical protein
MMSLEEPEEPEEPEELEELEEPEEPEEPQVQLEPGARREVLDSFHEHSISIDVPYGGETSVVDFLESRLHEFHYCYDC